jgi:hypothetical protein
MKVFVFSAHSLWTPHYATELEIIENHILNGDDVFHFTCYGDLKACDLNIKHRFQVCLHCADQTNCGRRLLTGNVPSLPIIKLNGSEQNKIKEFVDHLSYNSIEEVQQVQYKNFDVGYAATASLISIFRDSKPDVKKYAEEIVNLMISSLEVYESTLKYIARYKPDRTYAFNGRFAQMKAVLRASQSADIECYIHERGADMNKYDLWRNTTPHDIKYMVNLINDYWDKADKQVRTSIGENFYTERAKGVEQGWYSFTKHQDKVLPDNWDHKKKNIVIFNSYEDDFSYIGPEWTNPIYKDQLTGIKKIVEDLSCEKDIKVYLRVHPNLRDVDDESTRAIYSLNYENLTIVPADSKVSSYELLFNANCVITFGSTMGIEAVYWRIPSISLGKSFYYDMEATYNPPNHEELITLLKSDLKSIGYEQSLKFGYFYKTFGLSYNIYKPISLLNGSFKSIDFEKQVTNVREIVLKGLYTRFIGRPLRIFEKLYQKKKWKLLFWR